MLRINVTNRLWLPHDAVEDVLLQVEEMVQRAYAMEGDFMFDISREVKEMWVEALQRRTGYLRPSGRRRRGNPGAGGRSGGISILYGALARSATPFPLFVALRKGLTLRGYTLFEVLATHRDGGGETL
jgi:hypothetical protein